MDTVTTPLILDEERARRQKAVTTARDSIKLEGFDLMPEVEALNASYIAGELTSEELTAAIKRTVG